MKNPAQILPGALPAIQELHRVTFQGDVSPKTLALLHQRVSQINGCSFCIDTGWRHAKKGGETDERLFTVAAWRDAPYFTLAERAALALAESVTRLSDREDAVPDAVWSEAAKHYSETQLAALLLSIAVTNLFNRINVPTRQPAAGEWKAP
jgi:AhpD family alkylhydroperoxidase